MAEVRRAPQAGPQESFLASSADIVFYGGAAGGGKTHGLLLETLRHVGNPGFGAVIFRRTSPQVRNEGALWDESEKIFQGTGAEPKESSLEWSFPSGANVKFAHMEHEKTRLDWQGSQIPLIGFDELTHFTRKQFFYMLSRNRSTCGVRPYVRATCNPVPDDDETGGWIHEFVDWYIGDDGFAISERSGIIRWFVTANDTLRWADDPESLATQYPDITPKSFTFIMSSVYDNPALLEVDPGYIANLQALPQVEREQLLGDKRRGGNWKVKPSAGKVFNRKWFEIVDAVPPAEAIVRFWDLAASEKKMKGDPDFTAGVKMQRTKNIFYVLDSIEERMAPGKTDTAMRNTASQDGPHVKIQWEEEGGASGKRDSHAIATNLLGYNASGVRPQGDKLVRARSMSSQAEAGNVKLLRGDWNQRWLAHMHGQPDLAHDDTMDASTGAFNELVGHISSLVDFA